jgi:hypothetical protein
MAEAAAEDEDETICQVCFECVPCRAALSFESQHAGPLAALIAVCCPNLLRRGWTEPTNQMLYCDSCNIAVHQGCYGIAAVPDGDWFCAPCERGLKPVRVPVPPSMHSRYAAARLTSLRLRSCTRNASCALSTAAHCGPCWTSGSMCHV